MILSLGCSGVVLLLLTSAISGRPAIRSLSYYETLNYDPSWLADQHVRVSREARATVSSMFQTGHVHFSITAFNRTFRGFLRHSKTLFTPDAQFLVNGKHTSEYDPLTFYEGPLHDEKGSMVSGHIINGVFDGVIHTAADSYHVERAHKFPDIPVDGKEFHSIMYRASDVAHPTLPYSCGVKEKLLEKMKRLSSHAVPLKDEPTYYGTDDHNIVKRQIGTNRFCQVRVAADHLFLANEGGGSIADTMSEVATIMNAVGGIYRETNFGQGIPAGVQPVVAKLEVFQANMPGYRFGRSVIAVEDFLDLWSQEDQSGVCLALLLTYRDFANGVLGLAWVAEPNGGNRGGICEGRVRLSTGERYLNTGIVTTLNFGQRQPRSVTQVTVAHEFGHNFGSPHDPSGACAPGGSGGNFIMFAQATDGALPNNKRFSSCSINSIRAVLNDKASCFTANSDFCGNGVIEGDEQCDCGSNCANDRCCEGSNCTLTAGSECSPSSVEVCCSPECKFLSNDTVCRSASECGDATNCSGSSSSCPPPPSTSDIQLCNGNRSTCINGICAGSLCAARDYQDCQCVAGTHDNSQLCDVCCMGGPNDVPCRSSFDIFGQGQGERLRSGRSCNNFQGYCSNANPPTCVFVDNERTLNDLLDIFTIATLNRIVAWLRVYWYIPVGVIVGLIIIFILLQVTYRRRKPLKRRLSQMRRRSSVSGGNAATPGSRSGGGRQARRERDGQRNREISQQEAEQRLKAFFPTADRDTLVSVMRVAGSESKSVKRLLDLGFPLKKRPLPRS